MCAYHFNGSRFFSIHNKLLRGEAKMTIIDSEDVLKISGQVCVQVQKIR